MRKRFRLRIDEKFVGVDPARLAEKRRAPLPEILFEPLYRRRLQLRDGFDPNRFQRAFGDLPDAGNPPHRQRRKKRFLASRRHPHQPARLGLLAGHFGNQARCAHADRARQPRRGSNFPRKLVRRGERGAVQPLGSGKVDVSLVDRGHFDDGRIFREDRRDAVAPLAVEFVVAFEKHRLRTKLRRGAQRHRRVHAESPRFIARGGNHAALIALAADHNRQAFQIRPRQQLHRHEKCVHVDVENGGGRIGASRLRAARASRENEPAWA